MPGIRSITNSISRSKGNPGKSFGNTSGAATKKWIILEGKFEEEECLSIAYKKSFLGNIWSIIVKVFKGIIKLFIR